MDAKQKVILIAVAASFIGGKIAPTISGFLPASFMGDSRPLIVGVLSTAVAAYGLTLALKSA